ncbi:MAG: hypothetical protein U1G07_08880 [Verrucomicrobiota bacterium]
MSNPSAPKALGSASTGSGPVSVAVSGSYAYVVTHDSKTLEVFALRFEVSAQAEPAQGGVVTAGTYEPGSVATVNAAAKPGFRFASWTEDGTK